MGDAFPVLWPYTVASAERRPATVPWQWVEQFARRLDRNHGQTVRRLAERGGLDPSELWCAFHDKELFDDGVPELKEAAGWLRGEPWSVASVDKRTER